MASVFVDLGPQGTGIIYGREFFLAQELLKQCNTGDTISAKVIEPENEDGYIELSVSAAYREIAWEKLNRAFHEKTSLTVEVEGANRGGLMATVEGVKAFLPVSQLSQENYPRVEGGDKEKILEALKDFIGETEEIIGELNLDLVACRILDTVHPDLRPMFDDVVACRQE